MLFFSSLGCSECNAGAFSGDVGSEDQPMSVPAPKQQQPQQQEQQEQPHRQRQAASSASNTEVVCIDMDAAPSGEGDKLRRKYPTPRACDLMEELIAKLVGVQCTLDIYGGSRELFLLLSGRALELPAGKHCAVD